MDQRTPRYGRLTVVRQATHLSGNGQTTHHPGSQGFSRIIESHEQPYVRTLTATPEWTPLDKGWLTHVGYIYVENLEQVPAVRRVGDKQVKGLIEIGFGGPGGIEPAFQVFASEHSSFDPLDFSKWYIRSADNAQYVLGVYPR